MLNICAWITENGQSHTQEDSLLVGNERNGLKVIGIRRCIRPGTRRNLTADAGVENEKEKKEVMRIVLV